MMTAKGIAESVTMTLVARAAMLLTPIIVTIFGSLSLYYLDSRFANAAAATQSVAEHVDRVEATAIVAKHDADAAKDRIIVLETVNAANDKLLQAILGRLQSIDTSIGALAQTMAAMTATVQALKERPMMSR